MRVSLTRLEVSFQNDARAQVTKKSIEKAGFKPFRVDVEPHIDRIDMRIITEI